MPKFLPRLVVLVLGLLLVPSCGNPKQQGNPDAGTCDPTAYPCGPYGYTPDNIIENLKLVGKRDHNMNGSPVDDAVESISLATYFQDKSIKALVVVVVAEWCPYCQEEQPDLVSLYNTYQPRGVALLEAVVQDSAGNPADITVSDRWATKYSVPFDMAVDPSEVLQPYYDISAFPMQMVIRTQDMNIRWHVNGGGDQALSDMTGELDLIVGN